MLSKRHITRLKLVVLLGLAFWVILVLRLFSIQVKDGQLYKALAQKKHLRYVRLEPKRGTIYDRHLTKLAVDLSVESFGVDPTRVNRPRELALRVSQLTGVPVEKVYKRISQGKSFVWLARKVDPKTGRKIKSWGFEGIRVITESKRYYPLGPLAGQVLGFTDIDNKGLEGIELGLDEVLRGRPGWAILEVDARGRWVPNPDLPRTPPRNGCDVVLTIDAAYQSIVEGELKAAVQRFRAKGGMAIVMNPKTGEILAMANEPRFDPNHFTHFKPELRRNRTVTDIFEPGSTFKIVTAAAALEMGVKKPNDLIFAENGKFRVAGRIFRDCEENGWLTFKQAIERSSNIAILKTAQELDRKTFYQYARAFGFGSRTGVKFPGELQGILRGLAHWSRISLATMSIGYGVSVTALQVATAYAAIANMGLLMEPKLIKAVTEPEGRVVRRMRPTVIRRVISGETARVLTEFLCGVVERGTGVKAQIRGVKVAGKTGTAMKLRPNGGGYDPTRFVSSFVGFLPADDPQLLGLVVIDEPQGIYWGGEVAAPTFRRIMTRIIDSRNGPKRDRLCLSPQLLGEATLYSVRGRQGMAPSYSRKVNRLSPRGLGECRTMPKLVGMSLRRAIRRLATEGIKAKVSGSGMVRSQYPSPGSRISSGEICWLKCGW